MIKERRCYYIECDKSGEVFEDEDEFSLFPDKDGLIEEAQENGWREIDGKWYSPQCFRYDADAGKYVVSD